MSVEITENSMAYQQRRGNYMGSPHTNNDWPQNPSNNAQQGSMKGGAPQQNAMPGAGAGLGPAGQMQQQAAGQMQQQPPGRLDWMLDPQQNWMHVDNRADWVNPYGPMPMWQGKAAVDNQMAINKHGQGAVEDYYAALQAQQLRRRF